MIRGDFPVDADDLGAFSLEQDGLGRPLPTPYFQDLTLVGSWLRWVLINPVNFS